MPKKSKSNVWCHFNKKNKDEAECVTCSKVLKCGGGSMSSLSYHLKVVHGVGDSEVKLELKKQRTLQQFIRKRSIEEDVARLASEDGFSFN